MLGEDDLNELCQSDNGDRDITGDPCWLCITYPGGLWNFPSSLPKGVAPLELLGDANCGDKWSHFLSLQEGQYKPPDKPAWSLFGRHSAWYDLQHVSQNIKWLGFRHFEQTKLWGFPAPMMHQQSPAKYNLQTWLTDPPVVYGPLFGFWNWRNATVHLVWERRACGFWHCVISQSCSNSTRIFWHIMIIKAGSSKRIEWTEKEVVCNNLVRRSNPKWQPISNPESPPSQSRDSPSRDRRQATPETEILFSDVFSSLFWSRFDRTVTTKVDTY